MLVWALRRATAPFWGSAFDSARSYGFSYLICSLKVDEVAHSWLGLPVAPTDFHIEYAGA